MNQNRIQFPATIHKVTTLADGSIRVVADTRELGAEELGQLFAYLKAEGWLLFAPQAFKADELNLPEITADTAKKTPSQRLRASLFVLWSQGGKKESFESFYLTAMERFIEAVKEKLT